jgi:hypothetical protein
MRLILMNAGQFYLCGYSQGAEVVVRILRLMLPGQPVAHRVGDLLKVITFGSACRPPGPTLLGNNQALAGRSGGADRSEPAVSIERNMNRCDPANTSATIGCPELAPRDNCRATVRGK